MEDGGIARRHDALARAGFALASELSLDDVLQKIVDLACEVSDARYGALGVLDSTGGIGDFLTHGVSDDERAAIGRLPEGRGLLGVLIREAQPVRLRRIQDDPRSAGFPPNHPPMTTLLGVPVRVRGVVFGDLYLTEKEGGGEFTQADEDAVVELALQAGFAIERARLQEELNRLALVEERERIAKELHDDIVQSLFAEGMALQAAQSMVHDPEAVRVRLEEAVDHIDRVIRDLRNYIFGLRPGAFADRRLDRELHDVAAEFSRASDIDVDVECDPEAATRLSERSADIVQAVREAVSNAVRHSGADRVAVAVGLDGTVATIEVSDNGKGFDPAAVAGKGQGLANIRARAEGLGGTLYLESSPGRGSRVLVRVPV